MISIQLKNMAGDLFSISIEPRATVKQLKQKYEQISGETYSEFFDDISIVIPPEGDGDDGRDNYPNELYPNEKRLDRCGITGGELLWTIRKGLSPIGYLLEDVRYNGLNIEKLTDRSWSVTDNTIINNNRDSSGYCVCNQPIVSNLCFTIESKFKCCYNPKTFYKFGRVAIRSRDPKKYVCCDFTGSHVFYYNKETLFMMEIPTTENQYPFFPEYKPTISKQLKRFDKIFDPNEEVFITFGVISKWTSSKDCFIIRESTRHESEKITNLIEKSKNI